VKRQEKLDLYKKNLKKEPASVEFVQSTEVYKRLESVNEKFVEANEVNKEFLQEVSKIVSEALNEIAKGIKITNADEIKLEPHFQNEFTIPEIKAPKVNVEVPSPTVIKQTDIFEIYKPADIVEDGSTKYYGYIAKDGKWFIMRESNTKNTTRYRYASGNKGFKSAFTDRAKQEYKYYDEVVL